ncbi:MAG: hypothetical protein MNPFHGCM_03029 [Gemmatimonadaceae bacterium]|nr:hypothetical protein [Gemmatimonadaceae bacterium]
MVSDTRRAEVSFELSVRDGPILQSAAAEAAVGDDALNVGPLSVSYLDADTLDIGSYRIAIDVWPDRRLVLTQLGRRFETFVAELRRARNRERVAGLLAHGITMPEVFAGAIVSDAGRPGCDVQVYDTHLTIVPSVGDPWQMPFGTLSSIQTQHDPPAIVLSDGPARVSLGQFGRALDSCRAAIVARRDEQLRALAALTGQDGFADGLGRAASRVHGFARLLERFTSRERVRSRDVILSVATGEPRLGFVQLLDPEGERLESGSALPAPWASFLLASCRDLTILEILMGPAAATYIFRGDIDAINRDLQSLHFRRAPLALSAAQAEQTTLNPYRLALRRLEPLLQLRSATIARLNHTEGWEDACRAALA